MHVVHIISHEGNTERMPNQSSVWRSASVVIVDRSMPGRRVSAARARMAPICLAGASACTRRRRECGGSLAWMLASGCQPPHPLHALQRRVFRLAPAPNVAHLAMRRMPCNPRGAVVFYVLLLPRPPGRKSPRSHLDGRSLCRFDRTRHLIRGLDPSECRPRVDINRPVTLPCSCAGREMAGPWSGGGRRLPCRRWWLLEPDVVNRTGTLLSPEKRGQPITKGP
jgi:hypothetical protein